MDPKSLEETKREVLDAKAPAAKPGASAPGLDSRGLPPGYSFKPDWEVTPREAKSQIDNGAVRRSTSREPHEWDITHIVDKDKLFPRAKWGQMPAQLQGQENDKMIVHCKSGGTVAPGHADAPPGGFQKRQVHGRRDLCCGTRTSTPAGRSISGAKSEIRIVFGFSLRVLRVAVLNTASFKRSRF